MAEVTAVMMDIRGVIFLTVVYDDVTLLLDTITLVTDREVTIEMVRSSNGQIWREATVQAGSYTYIAGGLVKRLEDLERVSLLVDF